mgnify:CR=1 FL=1
MNRAHYLRTDIRRLVKNYSIYLAIVGVAVSIWFSLENYAFEEGMVNGNALDTYSLAVNLSGIMIAYAFCAFSYATVFCEDLEHKYARYSINSANGDACRGIVIGSFVFIHVCFQQNVDIDYTYFNTADIIGISWKWLV